MIWYTNRYFLVETKINIPIHVTLPSIFLIFSLGIQCEGNTLRALIPNWKLWLINSHHDSELHYTNMLNTSQFRCNTSACSQWMSRLLTREKINSKRWASSFRLLPNTSFRFHFKAGRGNRPQTEWGVVFMVQLQGTQFTRGRTSRNVSGTATVPINSIKAAFRFSYLSAVWNCNTSGWLTVSCYVTWLRCETSCNESDTGQSNRWGGGCRNEAPNPSPKR
jgi:hypothetical protein